MSSYHKRFEFNVPVDGPWLNLVIIGELLFLKSNMYSETTQKRNMWNSFYNFIFYYTCSEPFLPWWFSLATCWCMICGTGGRWPCPCAHQYYISEFSESRQMYQYFFRRKKDTGLIWVLIKTICEAICRIDQYIQELKINYWYKRHKAISRFDKYLVKWNLTDNNSRVLWSLL